MSQPKKTQAEEYPAPVFFYTPDAYRDNFASDILALSLLASCKYRHLLNLS